MLHRSYLLTLLMHSVLAIDNGSTALRLGLVEYDRPDLFWPVENMENIRSDMHNPGEFPAACCPLREDWRESLGRNALDEPDHVLVKYLSKGQLLSHLHCRHFDGPDTSGSSCHI